jgi:hypothetical protein
VKLASNWRDILKTWRKETGSIGVRDLAVRLGGVSSSTAAKIARENP